MKSTNMALWVSLCCSGILVAASGMGAFVLVSQLNDTKAQVQELKTEIAKKDEKIADLEREKKQLEEQSSADTKELANRSENIRNLQSNVKVVGDCLEGVVSIMDAYSREDPDALLGYLISFSEPCRKAEEILESIEKNQVNSTL